MKKLLLYIILNSSFINAQISPSIEWQKCLGGSQNDYPFCISQTFDMGYIVGGYSFSNDGDVAGNHGGFDYWVVKLNSLGGIQWQKSLGGSVADECYSLQQTADGGYILAGSSRSNDGDVTGNQGNNDVWIVKLSSTGSIQWQKTFGSISGEGASSVKQTTDGGYVVAGYASINGGDVSGAHGNDDFWILKLDSNGNLQWQKCLGGTDDDLASSIEQTADGGYIVGGGSKSIDGDVTGNHGLNDYWVVKLSTTGSVQWQKSIGGSGDDGAASLQQTSDGGYIIIGNTSSNDGDVFGYHPSGTDGWIVKLNSLGSIEWQKCLGGPGIDSGSSIKQTTDGGYIASGRSASIGGDVTLNHGQLDTWVIKLDSIGFIQWQNSYGSPFSEESYSIQQTSDGGYIALSIVILDGGDVSGSHGNYDYWVVKLSPLTGLRENENAEKIIVTPNPSNGKVTFNCQENEYKIEIIDIKGRIVFKTISKNSINTIDLNEKDKGIYFYKITNSNKVIQQGKIIIQ